MKNTFLAGVIFVVALSSCTQGKYAASGSYENDEIYLRKGDMYISDYETQLAEANAASNGDSSSYYDESEDYYSGDGGSGVTNYYGDVYNYNTSPWNSYGYSPWNRYPYSSYNFSPMWGSPYAGFGWNVWDGWNFGLGWGFSSFYSPYAYYPYSYYGYYPYYNHFGHYGGYHSGWWGHHGNWGDSGGQGGNGIVYGPRGSISSGTTVGTIGGSSMLGNRPRSILEGYVPSPSTTVNKGNVVPGRNQLMDRKNGEAVGNSSRKPGNSLDVQNPSTGRTHRSSEATKSNRNDTDQRVSPTNRNSTRPSYNSSGNSQRSSQRPSTVEPSRSQPSMQNSPSRSGNSGGSSPSMGGSRSSSGGSGSFGGGSSSGSRSSSGGGSSSGSRNR